MDFRAMVAGTNGCLSHALNYQIRRSHQQLRSKIAAWHHCRALEANTQC
jgi:hypothetical protein